MASKPYKGHPSWNAWNAWNVALWINNDEGLYNLALECIHTTKTRQGAVTRFLDHLGRERTPDGARYTRNSVLLAIRGLEA